MISHRNVIANILQYTAYESVGRKERGVEIQVELGLVPMSHIYGLVVVAHGATWRGDEVIVLPKFELELYLAAIERFKIEHLIIVSAKLIRTQTVRSSCACVDDPLSRSRLSSSACCRAVICAGSTTSAASV
jgi:acyl-CoA synthetase (AMP-forming)/AMP-acid ligase II